MTLTIYRNKEEIDLLKDQWNELLLKCYHKSVFCTYGFIHSWYEAYKHGLPLIICITNNDNKPDLIAPLVLCEDGWLRIAGYKRGDYNTILFNRDKPEIFRQFLNWIHQHKLKLELSNQHETNLTFSLLTNVFKVGKHKWLRFQYLKFLSVRPFVVLKEKEDCPYISRLNHNKVLSKIKESKTNQQRLKNLSKLGDITYSCIYNKDEIRNLLPTLFQMHITEWKNKNEFSLFLENQNKLFYELLVKNLSSNELRMDILKLNTTIIAMHLGFEDNETVYYYKPCYDITYKKNSTGSILLNYIIEDTLKGGKNFDFLKGSERYKNYYTNDLQTLRQVRIQPGVLRNQFHL